MNSPQVAIIGAGAAGCFLGQRLRQLAPQLHVQLYEAHPRPLMKVAVTGGGRCNLTNSFRQVTDLQHVYPRGHRLMKRLMHQWDQHHTMQWFEQQGVPLVTQDDECVFPVSQDAMQIVHTLQRGLDIRCNYRVQDPLSLQADYTVVTTGGSRSFQWLQGTGVQIEPPVPSLFPLRLKPTGLEQLMGLVFDEVTLTIAGTRLRSHGTLLITHFGVSGPTVLRLSSYAARHLAQQQYQAPLIVNWLGDTTFDDALYELQQLTAQHPDRQLASVLPRLAGARWVAYMIQRSGLAADVRCKTLTPKHLRRLATQLTADEYHITGRAPHKEEFVTCGGVSLTSIDSRTLECKTHPHLYFAGEVLDLDGITGGFNLQAAFTTANAIAEAIAAEQ